MIDCQLELDNLSEKVNPISIKVFEAEEKVKIEERLEVKEPDLGFFLLEAFHRCFFGKGGYYVYPVLWVFLSSTLFLSLAITSIIPPNEDSPKDGVPVALQVVALQVETVVNFYFAYDFFNTKQLEKLLKDQSSLDKHLQTKCLQAVWVVVFVLACVTLLSHEWNYLTWSQITVNCGISLSFFVNFYLCGLWCWVVGIIYWRFHAEIYPRLLSEDTMELFEREFFPFALSVEAESINWRTNHLFRTITGLFIATSLTINVYVQFIRVINIIPLVILTRGL